MSIQDKSQVGGAASPPAPDDLLVAAAAERVLAAVDEALTETSTPSPGSQAASPRIRAADSADPAVAKLQDDLEAVQQELSEVTTGVVGMQKNSLRMTGVAALVLAVLIAIAWKIVGG